MAVYGIGRSQTNAEMSVQYILAAFKDEDSRVREAAVMAVGGVYKRKHAEIVPALTKAIEDPSPDVRKKAVTMLGWYGGSARAAIPALENVMMPQLIRGIERKEARRRSVQLLAYMRVKDRATHRPSELSGRPRSKRK